MGKEAGKDEVNGGEFVIQAVTRPKVVEDVVKVRNFGTGQTMPVINAFQS